MTRDRPTLCDTTLRDGQQTQGVSFSTPEKIQIAQAPDRLGLDYIEGGWPGANPTDNTFFETVPPTRATMTAFAGASEGSSSGFSRPFSRRAGHRDRKPAFREGRTPGRQVLQPLRRIRHSHRLHRAAQFREDKHPEPARSQLPPAGEPLLQPDNFTFAGAPYPVPCVFQVWARRGTERELAALPRTHPDFSFTDRSGAEFAFQRVGIRAGAVKTGFDSLAAASHHFIRANIPVSDLLEIFEDLDFAQVKSRTTGDPSISKTELVALYTAARSGAGGLSNSCRTGSRTDGT